MHFTPQVANDKVTTACPRDSLKVQVVPVDQEDREHRLVPSGGESNGK